MADPAQPSEAPTLTRAERIVVAIVLLGLVAGAIGFAVTGSAVPWSQGNTLWGWDFRNNLWGPAYLLLHGQSPYRIAQLYDGSNAIWLPMTLGLFFPLGWLALPQALNLWLVVSLALLGVMFWLAWGRKRPTLAVLALSALFVCLFPPVLSHLILGQLAIPAMVLMLLAALLVETPHLWLSSLLVVVALGKPQLTILVIPGLLVACHRAGGIKAMLQFAGALALWSAALTVPLWLGYADWVEGFIAALARNKVWAHPSLFSILNADLGVPGLLLWGLVAGGAFGLNAWLWRRRSPNEAAIWSLALTTLVTPYLWSWDFVLLLPLLVHALTRLRSRLANAVLILGYGGCWTLMLHVRLSTDNDDVRFWWVPWFIVAVVGAAALVDAWRARKSPMAEERDS